MRTPGFLGRVPVPLRQTFQADIERLANHYEADTGKTLRYETCSGAEWFAPFKQLNQRTAPQNLPDMLCITGSADILSSPNLTHYRNDHALLAASAMHPAFAQSGLPDPQHIFHLFAAIPFVLLIDHEKLDGRPAPRRWADLLNPLYQSDIVFGGWKPDPGKPYTEFNRFLLLAIYRFFGSKGLHAFAQNVKDIQHHVVIARTAGTRSPQASAISILPWMQASMCPHRAHTEIIWPDDGALTMPLACLIQPKAITSLRPLIDYFYSAQWQQFLMQACYPPVMPTWCTALPNDASFKWLGWDFVRENPMLQLSQTAATLFFNAWIPANRIPVKEYRQCS
ncbi:ABC transporter substrate-binding protein [Tolumonas lignilytica]|jgi:hypothetical protein|uniref:ABC transporter substrate-binding protein n=1 Tax=Tolumonas lignilytica TaxID=1283284 RepID=UPI0004B1AC7E|nr:ABC transporter substrate-binding protein [Tolumonas lignilytica]